MDSVLVDLIRSSSWMMRVLGAVRDEAVADAWVGAGVLRDLVWGERYGPGFCPERVRDVDVAFFDPADLSRANDDRATEQLARRLAGVPWEAMRSTSATGSGPPASTSARGRPSTKSMIMYARSANRPTSCTRVTPG